MMVTSDAGGWQQEPEARVRSLTQPYLKGRDDYFFFPYKHPAGPYFSYKEA